MTAWNPNEPLTIGPEFFGGAESSVTPIRQAPTVQHFASTAAETIAAVRLYYAVSAVVSAPTYLAELFLAGDELDDGLYTTDTFAPNVLTGIVGTVTDEAGGAVAVGDVNAWPPTFTNYAQVDPSSSFDLEFAAGALPTAGRIASVAVEVVSVWGVTPSSGGTWGSEYRTVTVSLINAATVYGSITRTIPNNAQDGSTGRSFFNFGEINPITGQPWTVADVAALDTATTRVRIAKPSTGGQLRIADVRLIVVYETVERRVARGAFSAVPGAAAWSANIPLASPAGVANWGKAAATSYALVTRQADQGNLIPTNPHTLRQSVVLAIDGESPPPGMESYVGQPVITTWLADGGVSLSGFTTQAQLALPNRVIPFVLRTTAPATSVDGEPYAEVRNVAVFSGSGASQQELRTSAPDNYGALRVALGWFPAFPTEDLVVYVKRRSDNAVMGTFTITPPEIATVPFATLAVIASESPSPGIALAAATQYYLDFVSATPSGTGWIVGLLAAARGAGTFADYEPPTYGGGTDQADPIAGTAAAALTTTPADFISVLDAATDPPGSFAASAETLPLPDTQPCQMDGIPYALLAWDPTGLGADFGYYEVQRLATDNATWETIAQIPNENMDGFPDLEARIGIEESYRLRVVLNAGAGGSASYWTDTITVTLPSAGCGYAFTTNQAPWMSVAYPDVYDGRAIRDYQFPETAEVEFRKLYGRPYQVAFHPIERRGSTFTRKLLIGGLAAAVAGVGVPAAGMLRDLAWAFVDYVCVRDNDGNRWFANIRVPDLDAYQDAGNHLTWVTVQVVEVTATPSIATVGIDTPGGPMEFVEGGGIFFVDGSSMEAVT